MIYGLLSMFILAVMLTAIAIICAQQISKFFEFDNNNQSNNKEVL